MELRFELTLVLMSQWLPLVHCLIQIPLVFTGVWCEGWLAKRFSLVHPNFRSFLSTCTSWGVFTLFPVPLAVDHGAWCLLAGWQVQGFLYVPGLPQPWADPVIMGLGSGDFLSQPTLSPALVASRVMVSQWFPDPPLEAEVSFFLLSPPAWVFTVP
jgi:hypothetical protein